MNMFTPQEIRELRHALEMNTTEFATVLGVTGVTVNTVARWEIGDRHPKRTTMIRLNELAAKSAKKLAKQGA